MTTALVVGSGQSTDLPSEPSAAPGSAIHLKYTYNHFSGRHYQPAVVPAEERSAIRDRLLLALGYAEQAAEAEAFAEASRAAQTEVLFEESTE